MSKALHWGILGTGNIARQFAAGAATSRRSVLQAVGSRTESSARAFAQAHRVSTVAGSYEQILADPSVDAIYVSLPNSLHHEWTIKALRAGKHVLCEKPFAINASQSQEMFDVARRAGRVLIEAFMYRAHPLTHAVMETVRSGAIGQVKLIRTSFCYRTTRIAGNIRFSSEMSGGALMDIGCYCTSYARLVAGADPVSVHAYARLHESGVDEMTVGQMIFPGGVLASFTCGMGVQADNTAYICGDEGYIESGFPWKPPSRGATYTIARSTPPRQDQPQSQAPAIPPGETRSVDANQELYGVEADAFAAVVLDGAPPFVTEAETLCNMRVLDEMRRQVGIEVK